MVRFIGPEFIACPTPRQDPYTLTWKRGKLAAEEFQPPTPVY